jgi:colicin import membrane protein
MWELIRRNPLAAFLAVLMHLLLLGFMIVGVDWLKRPHPIRPSGDLVQARVVDAQQVQAEANRLRHAEVQRQQAAEAAQRREEQRLEDLHRKQEAERQRLAALEKQRQAEAAKQALERKKAAQEAARLSKLKAEREALEQQRQQEDAQRKAEEHKRKAEEHKRKAEEQKRKGEEAKRLAEDQKRKADEQRRQQDEARKKAEADRLAAEQRAREDSLRQAMEAEEGDREIRRYAGLITDKIERSWLRPLGVGTHLKATLRVRMIPGGGVIAVSVIQSSGNGAFDRSAEAAVRKADPLPVPSGALFDRMRELDIIFDPDKS